MPKITNYDHCLRFQVIDKRISFIDDNAAEVVADNKGNICIHIEFDEQWDGIGKTARFIYNGEWKDAVLNTDNECICPSEVLKKGRFSLGVYGADLKVTTPITVTVLESILSDAEGEIPDDPTPGVYNQIMTQYQATAEAADAATQAAWDAIEKTDEAINALNVAKQELEEGGFITKLKEANKGKYFSVWIGTSEEYKKVPARVDECLYIITDEDDIDEIIAALKKEFDDKLFIITTNISNHDERIEELEAGVENNTKALSKVGKVLWGQGIPMDDLLQEMIQMAGPALVPGLLDYQLVKVGDILCTIIKADDGSFTITGTLSTTDLWDPAVSYECVNVQGYVTKEGIPAINYNGSFTYNAYGEGEAGEKSPTSCGNIIGII